MEEKVEKFRKELDESKNDLLSNTNTLKQKDDEIESLKADLDTVYIFIIVFSFMF